jgi:hypothetical protein
MLDSPSLDARLGACQALARLGNRAEPAVPKLREALKSDELLLQVQAACSASTMSGEGIKLLADCVRLVKPRSSQNQVPVLLSMLERYGAQAPRVIFRLEKAIHYFENEEENFPKKLSLQKAEAVRETIREILTSRN